MKNIIIAEFKHETNSFAFGLSDETAFRNKNYLTGDDILTYFKGVKSEVGAFLDFFEDKENYNLIPAMAFNAEPGGIVAKEVFENARRIILETYRNAAKVDGILFVMHGAMVTEEYQDGEGEILSTLRVEIGPDIPIMITLDLHANITKKMIENCDGMFVFDYYPHTDRYETGMRAAQCMFDTLEGKVKPVLRYKKLDMMLQYMPTAEPCMEPFMEEEKLLRKLDDVINVNICHGFFPSDIYEQGMSVVVTTNNNPELAQNIADTFGEKIWNSRKLLRRDFCTIDQAIDLAMASDEAPFVFADVADNPGAGATCDGTFMLRRLLERGVTGAAVAAIYDPEVVQIAEKAGIGETIHINLGGKIFPDIAGEPIECDAYVKSMSDGKFINKDYLKGMLTQMGKCAVLVINGNTVIVSSIRTQPWDLEAYRINGITPQDAKILMVKSAVHFRTSFEKVSNNILYVEVPALAPQSPEMMVYKHTRRPIYPLDEI